MSKHAFFSLLLVTSLLFGVEEGARPLHQNIEITAKELHSTRTTVTAKEGVVVYYRDTVIKADSATYDKEKSLLLLDGDIETIGYLGTKEHTRHLEIHTDTEAVTFKELFFISKNDVWLFTKDANKNEGNYTFGETVLSSCEVTDPIWKMVASRLLYDSREKYMQAYDTKVYFKDIPVFYTPYMAFSTDRHRKSGVLFPFAGYRENEGFLYEQPLYWAMNASMDLEVNPQIRTKRGYGMYGTFRFVDSDHSSGAVRLGYFRDKNSYMIREGTTEKEHYGIEAKYDSTKILSDLFSGNVKDGLYFNAIYLNDIEYLNLQQSQFSTFGQVAFQESKFNYFLADEAYYLGVNAKYFIDTSQADNDETIQQLPVIQLHKYLDALFWNTLTYSVDLQFKNLDRKEGTTMKQAELKVPFEFTKAFFDDFVTLSLAEMLYYNKSFFGNGTYDYDNFHYFNNFHTAKIFSDLTRKYDGFIHVFQPSLQYILPGSESQHPVDFDHLSAEQKALFVVNQKEECATLSLSQYFYDTDMHLKFFQRISQKYYTDRAYHFSDISNEMQYNWGAWQFYSDITYAVEFNEIRESATRISLNENHYNFSLSHTYKQTLSESKVELFSNDLNLNFGYRWSDHFRLHGGITYNIDTSESKQWLFGGEYKQDCWGVKMALRQDITPRPEGRSTTENSFYVQFDFTPFVSIGSATF